MDLRRAYAETVWPGQWTIFGLQLRPLSLGHALLLRRLGLEDKDTDQTLQAIWLCHHDWRKASQIAFRSLSIRGQLWLHSRLVWAYLRPNLALQECLAWSEYLQESWSVPQLTTSGNGSAAGAPDLLQLKVLLQGSLGYRHAEAMGMPVAQAIWECAAYSESQGGCTFKTDYDETLEKLADRMRKGELMPDAFN